MTDTTLLHDQATPTEPDPETGWSPVARQVRDLLLVLIAGLALVTAGTVGYALAPSDDTPTSSSADAAFLRDMSVHHAQAVQMSWLLHDRTSDGGMRYLTYDIATGQQGQIGMMSGWLSDWGLNQTDSSQPRMAWMTQDASSGHGSGHGSGHDSTGSSTGDTGAAGAAGAVPDGQTGTVTGTAPGMASSEAMGLLPDGRMPGMASAADLARLTSEQGRAAEVDYLRLMIAHHRGGVAMARAGLQLTERPAVRQLAQSIVDSQSAEITAMQDLLRERGAGPA